MNFTRRHCLALATGLVAAASCGSAFAAVRSIEVSLWDSGDMALHKTSDGMMMGMGMGGATTRAMAKAHMGIRLSSRTVRAGKLSFNVRNDSKLMAHEMVVSPIKNSKTPLPYLQGEDKVDEKAAVSLGEVAELEPGKSGTLTLTLKPGRYILYCNVAGHYAHGMWTVLTVT